MMYHLKVDCRAYLCVWVSVGRQVLLGGVTEEHKEDRTHATPWAASAMLRDFILFQTPSMLVPAAIVCLLDPKFISFRSVQ
jgi:hypothetical protein